MASISCNEAAAELLRQCIEGTPWDRDLALELSQPECADALFRILFEGLADRFERKLCDDYVAIFSSILQHTLPDFRATDLIARYQRIREPKVCRLHPKRVAVLSRVTLGADIAITSVLLDAASTRFPDSEIWFAGSAKAAELFSGLHRVKHMNIPYGKGTISQRLEAWRDLSRKFEDDDWLVIDPDSRLTQLGLLPIVDDDHYLFFESRAYGGETTESLTTLAKQWARETLEVEQCENRIAPPPESRPFDDPYVAISLGTADNPAKQMSPAFESALIHNTCDHYPHVVVDRGFGDDEAARVSSAVFNTCATTWSGSFASFVSIIKASACYIGYDSAGQHAAAALGVPLICLFKGFVNERMFLRWQPAGEGFKRVLRIRDAA